MEQVYIYVDVDREAAILAGRSEYGLTAVAVDVGALSAEERATLAACPMTARGAAPRDVSPHDPYNIGTVGPLVALPAAPDTSLDTVRRLLQARPTAIAAYHAKQAEREDQERAQRRAALVEAMADPERRAQALRAIALGQPPEHALPARPSVGAAWWAEHADECAAELEAIRAEIERKRAEQAAKHAREEAEAKAGRERLRTWALEHGSETLRLRIELEAGEWEDLARDEYADAHAPRYGDAIFSRQTWQDSGRDREREKPSAAELRALKAMRECSRTPGSLIRDPRLRWCVVDADTDDDEAQTERFAILALEIECPDGAEVSMAIRF